MDIIRKEKPSCSPKTTFKKGQIVFVPLESRATGERNSKWKGGQIKKKCLICKKEFSVDQYRKETAKYCSPECKIENSQSEKHRLYMQNLHKQRVREGKHNLYHGLTGIYQLIRHCSQYKFWRKQVFKRDEYTCQKCGKIGGKLNADHKRPFCLITKKNKVETFDNAIKCKELWDINNGKTLCEKCHRKTETWGMRSNRILLAKKQK